MLLVRGIWVGLLNSQPRSIYGGKQVVLSMWNLNLVDGKGGRLVRILDVNDDVGIFNASSNHTTSI